MTIKAKKVCAGVYTYTDTTTGRVVEVVSRNPHPAHGDTKEMWVAAARWSNDLRSERLEYKADAVAFALSMLAAQPATP